MLMIDVVPGITVIWGGEWLLTIVGIEFEDEDRRLTWLYTSFRDGITMIETMGHDNKLPWWLLERPGLRIIFPECE